jgi:small subunit ribosomal protein S17
MADEEKNETTEEQPDAPEATEEAAAEAPAEEAPKDEAPAEEAPKDEAPAEEAPKDDAPAEEASKEDAPAEEAPKEPSADAPQPDGPAGKAEEPSVDDDDDDLDWKARQRLARSRESGAAGPQRSPEDRHKERLERRKAAKAERTHYRKRARGKREKGTGTEPAEKAAVDRKVRQGTVVSSKPDKTITVRIDVARRHPVYEKVVRQTGTLHAHDEANEANEGDLVRIVETRPISKLKRWRLEQILEKAK